MKTALLKSLVVAILFCQPLFAQGSSLASKKLQRILNAMSFSELTTEADLIKQVKVACQNSQCSAAEQSQAQALAAKMSHCQLPQLKTAGVDNRDLSYLCRTQQAMLGCDSLVTPLMRKMCYSANGYSLQTLAVKENSILKGSRQPASVPKKSK